MISSVLVGPESKWIDDRALNQGTKEANKFVVSVLNGPRDTLVKNSRDQVDLGTSCAQGTSSTTDSSGGAASTKVRLVNRVVKSIPM